MDQFKLTKDQLVQIVSSYQQRSYAQEIEKLAQKGEDIEWMVDAIKSNQKQGISSDQQQIKLRKESFGSNQKIEQEPPGILELFCNALEDTTLRILIVAALLSIGIEVGTATEDHRSTAWIEGVAVLVAVFICASVTSINDYQKERQFKKLNAVADDRKKITVRRNDINMEIHQDFVLVGDIVTVCEGMEIPADGILLESSEITTDQSAMTGQTEPVQKNTFKYCLNKKNQVEKNGEKNITDKHEIPSPILMSGTRTLTGQGKMMVLVVGDISCLGKIRALLSQEEAQPTPLQQKLEQVAEDIGKFGLYSAIFIVVVMLIRFGIQKIITPEWDTGKDLTEILKFFILGITVVVVAIPEGLPLAVTLSLAFSVKKMLNDNNLVRKMEACETMGGANNICSDKTGTLTMNKMTLTQIWNGHSRVIDTVKDKLELAELSHHKEFIELFKIATCVNSTAQLEPEKGSSTEISILKYVQKLGVNFETERTNNPPKIKYPFSSSRKRMSVVLNYKENAHIFVKGASEMVLSSAVSWHNAMTNEVEPITQSVRIEMNNAINKMAENSLRTLCLAYKKLQAHDDLELKDEKGVFEIEKQNLVILAILGVQDIPRKEVPYAIEQCHKAGITVRMVTGDNIITARAIAKQVGIIKNQKDAIVMEGPDFSKLVGGVVCKKCKTAKCNCPITSKDAQDGQEVRVDTIANAEEFDKIKDRLLVLARSRPEDKYALVTGLKERGNVVAVTGDGTNDAPALKKADVGFAMGICGTEVARGAAAIILIDDNFSSIVKAVLWGRNIYDSIRKFIQFQLTVNIVAVVCTLVGAAVLKQEVMKPIQMLWINLIMDTLASLALATEDPSESLLDRAPHSRDQYIISRTMLKHIIGQAIFQLIVIFILLFAGDKFIPEYPDSYDTGLFAGHPEYKWSEGGRGSTVRSGRLYTVSGDEDYYPIYTLTLVSSRHFTFIFNTFVMMQVFNFINARKLHQELNVFAGLLSHSIFYMVLGAIMSLQIILVTFGGNAFGVYGNYGLNVQQWAITIAIGSISLVVNLFLKLLPWGKHDHVDESVGGFGNKPAEIRRTSVLSLKRIEERIERDLAKNHPLD